MGNENKEYLKGAQIMPFFKSFTVNVGGGNKGPLLLRKDEGIFDGQKSRCLSTSMYFKSGMVFGATIPCMTEEQQNELFDSFSQEDADAIAKHSHKEVSMYLKQIHDGKENIDVEPKDLDVQEKRAQVRKEDFKNKVREAMKKAD